MIPELATNHCSLANIDDPHQYSQALVSAETKVVVINFPHSEQEWG